jgi:hypothetical protein
MPNLNEFFGPKPTVEQVSNLEKIVGDKPCSKCDKDAGEAYFDPATFTMSWTCPDGHQNTFRVS